MSYKYFYILMLLYFTTNTVCVERLVKLKVFNVTCLKYTERLRTIECEYQQFLSGPYGISLRMIFNQDLDRTFRGRVIFDIMPINSCQVIHFLDFKRNGCDFLKDLKANQFLKILMKEFRRSANLPPTCLFNGDYLYRSDNFTLTENVLPPYAPLFNFTFTVEMYERNEMFGMWQIIGATVPNSI